MSNSDKPGPPGKAAPEPWLADQVIMTRQDNQARVNGEASPTERWLGAVALSGIRELPPGQDQPRPAGADDKTIEEATNLVRKGESAAKTIGDAARRHQVVFVDPPLSIIRDLPATLPDGAVVAVHQPDALRPVFDAFNRYDPKKPGAKPEDAEFNVPEKLSDNDSPEVRLALSDLAAYRNAPGDAFKFLKDLRARGIKIIPIGRSDSEIGALEKAGPDGTIPPADLRRDQQRTEDYYRTQILELRKMYPDAPIVAAIPNSGRSTPEARSEVTSAPDLVANAGLSVRTFALPQWFNETTPGYRVAIGADVSATTCVPTRTEGKINAVGRLVRDSGPEISLAAYDGVIFFPVAK